MLVSSQVSQLQQQGRLNGAALAQMFQSVSDKLNDALPEGQHDSVKKEVVHREICTFRNVLYTHLLNQIFLF